MFIIKGVKMLAINDEGYKVTGRVKQSRTALVPVGLKM